jgi:cation diffusion facilitator CzcD-associated flavoprotein CzcO
MAEYRFNSNIETVSYDHGWTVTSQEPENLIHKMYDVLVIATGAIHKPYVTDLHDPEFEGVCFHSLYYDDPSVLDNRTVLITGGGNSAKDIFWGVMKRAERVILACPTEQGCNNVVFPEDERSKLQGSFT